MMMADIHTCVLKKLWTVIIFAFKVRQMVLIIILLIKKHLQNNDPPKLVHAAPSPGPAQAVLMPCRPG